MFQHGAFNDNLHENIFIAKALQRTKKFRQRLSLSSHIIIAEQIALPSLTPAPLGIDASSEISMKCRNSVHNLWPRANA